jgi:hypothetical protein
MTGHTHGIRARERPGLATAQCAPRAYAPPEGLGRGEHAGTNIVDCRLGRFHSVPRFLGPCVASRSLFWAQSSWPCRLWWRSSCCSVSRVAVAISAKSSVCDCARPRSWLDRGQQLGDHGARCVRAPLVSGLGVLNRLARSCSPLWSAHRRGADELVRLARSRTC